MFSRFYNFIKRPLADDQTTLRLYKERYNGLTKASVMGIGGTYCGSIRATAPAIDIVPQSIVKLDGSAGGQLTGTIRAQPAVENLNDRFF